MYGQSCDVDAHSSGVYASHFVNNDHMSMWSWSSELMGAGFTSPEVVKKIDSDEADQPKQGLEALLAQFQGIAPKDPLFAVIAYRDHKPGQA